MPTCCSTDASHSNDLPVVLLFFAHPLSKHRVSIAEHSNISHVLASENASSKVPKSLFDEIAEENEKLERER